MCAVTANFSLVAACSLLRGRVCYVNPFFFYNGLLLGGVSSHDEVDEISWGLCVGAFCCIGHGSAFWGMEGREKRKGFCGMWVPRKPKLRRDKDD